MKNKIIILIFFIAVNFSFAQVSSLIQGTVTDTKGNPIETDLYLTSENEHFIINTFHDGTFSNSIKPGETFSIEVKGYIVTPDTRKVNIPETDKYQEITHNIQIKKIEKGMTILSDDIFEKNSENLSADSKELIKEIKHIMTFHTIRLKVFINGSDIKKNKDETLKNRRKKLIMEFFKYGLDDNRVSVEIDKNSKVNGDF